ncbi:MAG: hypothetical protein D4R72_01350 [Nitrosopumilales archaeon]|nr:MAG: hypothetical protein D4R72_01350 [Nitrosopumilales archaeon]
MSDTRLIILGSVLAFAGFLLGGITGAQYQQYVIQSDQFDICYDYTPDGNVIKVKCDEKIQDTFFTLSSSLGLIGGGVFVLVKGIRGKWDQNVKSDEMVGPNK